MRIAARISEQRVGEPFDMGLLFWKDNRKIDAFAKAVADDLFSHIQPDVALQHYEGVTDANRKKQQKVEQWLIGVVNQMQRFAETNSLGVYGKARLQKRFSDRLLELGYDVNVTNKLVETILLRVS